MPLRFRQRILHHLADDAYQPAKIHDIALDLRVPDDERDVFDRAIAQLASDHSIEIDSHGIVRLPKAGNEVTGKLKVNARGFGFLIPDQPIREGDIFIPPDSISNGVSGDRVRVRLEQRRRGREGKPSVVGRVIDVIERGQTKFTGVLVKPERAKGDWVVEPDGQMLRDPVLIRDPHAKNAKDGDKVVIELLHYPEGGYMAEGVIVEVLGEAGKPSVETQAVITAHGLRDEFSDEVLDEARDAARRLAEHEKRDWPDREDLREDFTITIDPPDAKDFDDAISISYDEQADEWTLGVHIADVAHFVPRGGALDREAFERGNSVYLPRLVLPMLPEVLSNGVCSLQEGVPRLTKTAFIRYDGKGAPIGSRFCSSVIQSSKRLTYLEAQALIDGDEAAAKKHARTEPDYGDELIETLRLMDRLAKILRQRRRRDGMIVLNLPEVDLVFDEEGHVTDVVPEDDAFTHTIIEMFMVEANEAVARQFDDLAVPLIRRIHPDPSVGKMEVLQMYSMVAGMKIPDAPSRKDIQNLLEATRDSSAARAIHFAVLRTLTKASYSPALIGHYALASDHYTHFTSPIRRYPDLTVHRALEAFLASTDNGGRVPKGRKRIALGKELMHDRKVMDEAELIDLGRHCSETEVEAEEAERELREFLVLQYLAEHHLGETFDGVVTGATSNAVFVSVERFLVEGMVKVADLPQAGRRSERWSVNSQNGRLTAQQSGASIGLGDVVKVQIVAIDLALRHMDLMIESLPSREDKPSAKRPTRSQPRPGAGPRPRKSGQGPGGRGPQAKEERGRRDGSKPGKSHRKGHGQGRRGRRGG